MPLYVKVLLGVYITSAVLFVIVWAAMAHDDDDE